MRETEDREVWFAGRLATAVRLRCRDLAVVSRNHCVALGRPRWGSSGAGAYRPVPAFGRSHRCHCWVGPLLACSRCGSRAPRSAPPPNGGKRRIPTPPAVKRKGRVARLENGLARATNGRRRDPARCRTGRAPLVSGGGVPALAPSGRSGSRRSAGRGSCRSSISKAISTAVGLSHAPGRRSPASAE